MKVVCCFLFVVLQVDEEAGREGASDGGKQKALTKQVCLEIRHQPER